ncbi:TetR/AcrR family transcriptional regulator [Microbacterium profundi]|uniref:TetR/AcrR family transcriptional regulator n=1 Tax=Microbacterium profundi TaxID=450380 RepID=UPI00051A0645|nr:TetR/AcrR family transcriptional regulator [Microbacterium profundi]
MTVPISIKRRVRMPTAVRRQQIIDVSTSVIAERGYWGLSLQDVADSCGLTVNGVLHHFGSKDGLLVAVLDHRDRVDAIALFEILGIEIPSGASTLDDLSDVIVNTHLDLSTVCRAIVERNGLQPEIVRLYSVLEAESMSPEHPAHDYFTTRQQSTLAAFARLIPQADDAHAIARHLLAVMDGLQLQWLHEPESDLLALWDAVAAGIPALR